MNAPKHNQSFSAHGGLRDLPRGAVRMQEHGPAAPTRKSVPRKSYAGLLFVLLLLSCALLFIQNSGQIMGYINKPIRVVKMVNPLNRTDEGSVRAALAAHLDAGFFALDVQAIKETLEADPWIDKVTVMRIWPDTLSVAISEEVAIARWGNHALLNQYGESFAPVLQAEDHALPLLSGPPGMERKVMEQYQIFSQLFFETGLRVREISLSERGSWSLGVSNDMQINIGRNHVLERVQRFVSFYQHYLHTQIDQVAAIDLRYNNGISIRKKTDMPVGVASK